MYAIHEDIKKLCKEGVIGFYKGLEVITIFGFNKEEKIVFSVLTVVVAVEYDIDINKKPEILNEKRLEIKGSSSISFGIQRQYIEFDKFYENITALKETEVWSVSGTDLFVGSIEEIGRKFAPSDSTIGIPLNNILKNNYFSGSYVYEWFNVEKSHLKFLFEKPALLQELSSKVSHYLPLGIASLSDKLGNLILQLPISIIHSKISHQKLGSNLDCEIYWHIKADIHKRELQLYLIAENDSIYPEFYSIDVSEGKYPIKMQHEGFNHRYFIWDRKNEILLSASDLTGFISSINMDIGMLRSEPRVFKTLTGVAKQQRVNVQISSNNDIESKNASNKSIENFQISRVFEKERGDLLRRKEFIQYHKGDEYRALLDLRYLINEYGQKGVWLWDPYLSANDVLNTLFFCEHSNSELKAITILNHHEHENEQNSCPFLPKRLLNKISKKEINGKKRLLNKFEADLEENSGNKHGLNLEFRAKYGNHGWSFHDRFIIFPFTDRGAMAWSLGTSVNSLGQSHHIFQKVSHAQLIANSFDELWQELNVEECLVWKS
ncbi:VPA1262 family N-terminal domain-containing protein [Psychrobacter proteolyticus]|uniref:VPA1262 family N-terminal domain-containing protein n=1 Tax=Psychrobacter proteolyticus TaxID=147825 RepID=UPI00191A30FD|nr:VPA1262 family N-terminal domain-containing protein [Psychrobacter proteolyticus]